MAQNLETKLRCSEAELAAVHDRALASGASGFVSLRQVDTYFGARYGRLKLREIVDEIGEATAELIAYCRPDQSGSRWSDYERVPVPRSQVAGLKRAMSLACGVRQVVAKRRLVGLIGATRVHLDEVDGLGHFVELETVRQPGTSEAVAAAEHEQVIAALHLERLEVVAGSYVDLAERRDQGEQ